MYLTTYKAAYIYFLCVAILLTPRHSLSVVIRETWFNIFEFRKKESFVDVNFQIFKDVKKLKI